MPIDCDGVDGSFTIHQGGYVCAGPWEGYAWTATGSGTGGTIEPEDYSDYVGGESRLCASGLLARDYKSVGILGISLNNEEYTSILGTWSPGSTYTGIYVNFANHGGSDVRIQVQTPNSGDAFCALSVSPGGDTVYWSDFETECWMGGFLYEGEPIESVMLLVPGDELAKVDFDICIKEIYPVTSTPPVSNCDSDEFECDDGYCIPEYWYCDGIPDCDDNSDEIC